MAVRIAGGLTEKGVVVGNTYDKYGSNNAIARWLMCRFERELQSLVKASGESVLHEIGCGEGYWTIQLARQGFTVRGSDFSQIAVSLARENAALHAVNIPFSVKSIYDLDPSTDGAPLLVCCEVLEHLENARTALERLRFVAQRYLIVSVPCEPLWGILNMARGKYWSSLGNTPGHLQRWNRRQFTSLVSGFFEIVDSRTPLPWTMVLCRKP